MLFITEATVIPHSSPDYHYCMPKVKRLLPKDAHYGICVLCPQPGCKIVGNLFFFQKDNLQEQLKKMCAS